jgi:hypothetical protein
VPAVVHALWTGFMHYRLINPEALSADTFGQAVRWLLADQKPSAERSTIMSTVLYTLPGVACGPGGRP